MIVFEADRKTVEFHRNDTLEDMFNCDHRAGLAAGTRPQCRLNSVAYAGETPVFRGRLSLANI